MNPNRNSSSSLQPSVVFTCSQIPKLPNCPYTLNDFQRFRREQKMIDIQLKVGETRLQAHRFVLANSSPVLRAMLSQNWDPERKRIFDLGDDVIDPQIADDLLDFLYTRKVKITMDNAKLLLIAADFLDLPTLKARTDRFLADHVRFPSDDFVDWLNFTEMYHLQSLRKSCMKFVFKNYGTVLKMEELLTFPEDFLMQLLKDLKVFGSSIVNRAMFGLLIKWIKFDLPTRSDCLLNILKVFPFLEVSTNFITNTVLKEELIINSKDCFKLVNDSLNELSSLLKVRHLYFVRKSVYHLDVEAEKWTKKSPMIQSSYSDFCSAASGDKIYIFGGRSEVFDTKHDRWTQLPSMPVARSSAAAVTLNGYIYVSGGYEEEFLEALRSVDRYCMATNEWTSVAFMLKARTFHKMVSFNDSIFAIGGDWGCDKTTMEKYSPESNQWEMVPAFHLWDGDRTVFHQGKFFAFNLCRHHLIDNIDTVNVYDPLTDSTETFHDSGAVEILKVDTYLNCVSVGDKICALNYYGGILGEFDPVTRKWKKIEIDMSILGNLHYNVVVPQR